MMSSNKRSQLSCYIIGDDDLTLQCASIVLEKKYHLLGVISPSKKIQAWCVVHSIPYLESVSQFTKKTYSKTFDLLFSIVNREIIPTSILQYPQYYAINYHNAPLPKYAGLYATSWAIYNGELRHAVTWHLMEEKIDSGSILKQSWFDINKDDTALTLNLKCYEHASASFALLLEELANGIITPTPQNLEYRSYYGLMHKPNDFGFIVWDTTGESIDRMCRAFTFDDHINEIVSPKVLINGKVFIVQSHTLLDEASNKNPGSIVKLFQSGLQVATRTVDILINELVDLHGKIQDIKQLSISIHQDLPIIKQEYIETLSQYNLVNAKTEQFWINELLRITNSERLLLSKKKKKLSNEQMTQELPKTLSKKLNEFANKTNTNKKHIILTAIFIYLFRLNSRELSVMYSPLQLRRNLGELQNFLAVQLPFSIKLNGNMTAYAALLFVRDEESRLVQQGTYCQDIFVRYPVLKTLSEVIDVSVAFCETEKEARVSFNDKCTIYISENGSWLLCQGLVDDEPCNTYQHIYNLLDSIITDPYKRLFEYTYLTTQEKRRLLQDWNQTDFPYPKDKTITDLFEEQVRKTPHHIAVLFEDEKLTYQELNQRSNQLARLIRARYQVITGEPFKPDTLVPICVSRSLEMMIGLLGILKAGGAYVPIDPTYPDARIRYILEDIKAPLGLTHGVLVQRLRMLASSPIIQSLQGVSSAVEPPPIPENKAGNVYKKWILIEGVDNVKRSTTNLKPVHSAKSLIYVIYTSGSTGKPKGVMNIHQALVNRLLWMQRLYCLTADDTVLQKTVFTFDVSVWELFWALLNGGRVVLASSDTHQDPDKILHTIEKNKVTTVHFVPSMLEVFLDQVVGNPVLQQLKIVICSGEALPWSLKEKCIKQLSAKIYNLYGPTEAAIDVTYWDCRKHCEGKRVPIGKPIDNTTLYVLDDDMQPVPINVVGELYIGGDGLARGYFNNPTLTTEKFISNPFKSGPNERLYKTGDLVRWMPDGCIEYIARNDFQVKLRGFRIELGEIENIFNEIPGVNQSLAIIHQKNILSDSSKILVVYYTSTTIISDSKLIQVLARRLPEYMIPQSFVHLKEFPLMINGKIDRQHLPPPGFKNERSEGAQPRNQLERTLHTIWKRVLGLKTISTQDDFFRVGGDSLQSIRIVSKLRSVGIECEVKDIFEYPTIRELANYIATIQKTNTVERFKKDNLKILSKPATAKFANFTKNFVDQEILLRSTCSDSQLIHHLDNYIPYEMTRGALQSCIYLFPPGGGGPESYYNTIVPELSDHSLVLLNNLQVVIQQHNHDLGLELTYEDLASYYGSLIKKIHKKGPYDFFGWSFGGTLAFEVARQFEQQGVIVRRLVLIDPYFDFQRAYWAVKENDPTLEIGLLPSTRHYRYQLPEQRMLRNTKIILLKATQYYRGNFEFDDPRWDALPERDREEFRQYIHVAKYFAENVSDNYLLNYVDEKNLSIITIPCAHGDFIVYPDIVKKIALVLKNKI